MKHDVSLIASPMADRAIRRWDELKGDRSEYEREWEDQARLIRPQRGNFGSANPGMPRRDKPLSSAPIIAQSNFAAGLYGTLTNQANKWCGIRTNNPELNRWGPQAKWNDMVTERVLASFRPSVSSFYSSAMQIFADVATFGNGAQYDEVRADEGKILDITLSLAEVCYDIDAFGRVVEVVRRFKLTAIQAVDMFRDGGELPGKIHELAEKRSPDKLNFFHHVYRNDDYERGRLGPRGKRWRSLYVSEVGRAVVRDRGYDEMPFHAPRWEVETGQTYGTGPGAVALPSARGLTQMEAANLRAGQKAADPTLLAPDRETWPISGTVRPGRTVYGGVSMQGHRLVQPLDNFAQTGLSLEMQDRKLDDVRDAFHWSLLNLAGRTGMTATEVMEIQEEKMRLMAPHMGRVQEEFLAPKIRRRFAMLARAGQLPPPPEESAGSALEVHYTSAAAMAQKAAEGAAISRLMADLGPWAAMDQRYADRLDPDEITEAMTEARGAPARVLRDRAAADRIAEQRAQLQQAQAMVEAAPELAGAARDIATVTEGAA